MKKATHQGTREHNRHLVLKTVFEHDLTSRAEIARITSLTRTTVSEMIADLIQEGLVSEVGVGSSLGGKSPILLSLEEDSRYLIGLDLAQDEFRGAIVNLRGKIKHMVTLPLSRQDSREPLALVYQILDKLMQAACQPVIAISAGTPGLVNTSEGVVVNAVNQDWRNLPLASLLQKRYRLPVFVYNDSQAAAMGEFTYGSDHQAENNLVVINVGHGIGSGIILNGQLFQGDSGGAGEIGHIVVVLEGGRPCRCGHFGCLETVASGQALIQQVQSTLVAKTGMPSWVSPQPLDLDVVEQLNADGNLLVHELVETAGRYLGLAAAILVGTLNIHRIVLVGEMTRFGQPWLEAVRSSMQQSALATLAQDTQVEIGKLERNTIILGVCALLSNNYALLLGT
ncbi:MAG: hypothetical protein A2Z16_16535 [Chloroflexi bacterium RBG_16_54_18]|nr:MAG: hypothetical protein A2Z16_16535 [Chloroflexi bacterium RBG_16_54_18]